MPSPLSCGPTKYRAIFNPPSSLLIIGRWFFFRVNILSNTIPIVIVNLFIFIYFIWFPFNSISYYAFFYFLCKRKFLFSWYYYLLYSQHSPSTTVVNGVSAFDQVYFEGVHHHHNHVLYRQIEDGTRPGCWPTISSIANGHNSTTSEFAGNIIVVIVSFWWLVASCHRQFVMFVMLDILCTLLSRQDFSPTFFWP